MSSESVSAAVPAVESLPEATYWPCHVAGHRHVLESTALACMRAGESKGPANRKWTTQQLEILLGKRRNGVSEAELAAEYHISVAYVQVLLRHADSLRLRSARRRNRWDGTGNPWNWLSTPVYLQVKGEGLQTISAVRAALTGGALRDRGRHGLSPRRVISAELWRWLTWVGPDNAESDIRYSDL